MNGAPDPSAFWGMIATGASGLVMALLGLIWSDYRKKVERIESQLEGKVDKAEMERQRDNVATLFEKLDFHAQKDTEQFRELTEMIHRNHVAVMERLAKR